MDSAAPSERFEGKSEKEALALVSAIHLSKKVI